MIKDFIENQPQNPEITKQNFLNVNLKMISYPLILTYVLGAQKNRLAETVLLSTHNRCFS